MRMMTTSRKPTFEEEEEADDEHDGDGHQQEAGPNRVVVVAHEADAAQRVAVNLHTEQQAREPRHGARAEHQPVCA